MSGSERLKQNLALKTTQLFFSDPTKLDKYGSNSDVLPIQFRISAHTMKFVHIVNCAVCTDPVKLQVVKSCCIRYSCVVLRNRHGVTDIHKMTDCPQSSQGSLTASSNNLDEFFI